MSLNDDLFGILEDVDYRILINDFNNLCNQNTEENLQDVDKCKCCGNILQRNINNINNTCDNCGIVSDEIPDEVVDTSTLTNHKLRIVGRNSNQFQPDLYKSDNGNINALQKKQILNEYIDYRQRFIEMGGRAFPLNACTLATDLYNKIQQQCVKRSQNKKVIMAACLWHACLIISFAPSKTEIAKLMQLSNKGIAKGTNFIRAKVSEKKLDLNPNTNPIYPEIRTLFLQLNYVDEKYIPLHHIVWKLINISIENSICINSLPKSKVIAFTFVLLKRCIENENKVKKIDDDSYIELNLTYKDLIQNSPIDAKEFCKGKIRKNTIDRIINELKTYHSYFKNFYERVGLHSGLEYY